MLNENKIRIMTNLASFEKQEDKGAIRTAKYFRVDYIRLELLKAFFRITVGYVILIILVALSCLNAFIEGQLKFHYEQVFGNVVMGYFVLLVIGLFITLMVHIVKYNNDRKKIKRYKRRLKILRKYQ